MRESREWVQGVLADASILRNSDWFASPERKMERDEDSGGGGRGGQKKAIKTTPSGNTSYVRSILLYSCSGELGAEGQQAVVSCSEWRLVVVVEKEYE